jgi:hypothetical protein
VDVEVVGAAPIAKVAVPVALRPDGSVTVYMNEEDASNVDAEGLKTRPESWSAVRTSPE